MKSFFYDKMTNSRLSPVVREYLRFYTAIHTRNQETTLLCSKIAINCQNLLFAPLLVSHLLSCNPLIVPTIMPLNNSMQVWHITVRPILPGNKWLAKVSGAKPG
jgi:hypothetical protein